MLSMFEPKFVGNCKRIKEYDSLGLRPDAIVDEFKKHGIPISVNMVNSVLNGDVEKMSNKALPKVAVKSKKDEIEQVLQGSPAF